MKNCWSAKWCEECGHYTLHDKDLGVSFQCGCLLTILTCGSFLVVWIPIWILMQFSKPWKCRDCGCFN